MLYWLRRCPDLARQKKAVSHQYHTWFNWEKKNAYSFFGLFGKVFQDHMKTVVAGDQELGSSIRRFWRLGARETVFFMGIMVASYLRRHPKKSTPLYGDATKFVEWFPLALRQFAE